MQIRKLKPGAFVELECKHLVAEGLGLSYFTDDSMREKFKPAVFFIWGVLPGERFIARIAKVKSKYAHGILANREQLPEELKDNRFSDVEWALLHSSTQRVQSACEIFLRCGGCRLRQLSYQDTIAAKLGWLKGQLVSQKVIFENIETFALAETEIDHYRNHVQVHINKFGTYGFYEPFSYRTRAFPDHGCLIFAEKKIREKFPNYPVEVRASRIRINLEGEAWFTVLNDKKEAETHASFSIEWPKGQWVKIDFPMPQFFQVNLKILPAWLDTLSNYSAGSTRMLELYSGFGFISRLLGLKMPLTAWGADSLRPEQVRAVRISVGGQDVADSFAENYRSVDLFNCDKISEQWSESVHAFDPQILLVNPPRAGFPEATWTRLREKALSKFGGSILYSSCNAATMARDLGYLIKDGYQIKSMKMFDFFPWTHHYETVALLTR